MLANSERLLPATNDRLPDTEKQEEQVQSCSSCFSVVLASRTGRLQLSASQVCTPKRGKTQRLRMYHPAKMPSRRKSSFMRLPHIYF